MEVFFFLMEQQFLANKQVQQYIYCFLSLCHLCGIPGMFATLAYLVSYANQKNIQ